MALRGAVAIAFAEGVAATSSRVPGGAFEDLNQAVTA